MVGFEYFNPLKSGPFFLHLSISGNTWHPMSAEKVITDRCVWSVILFLILLTKVKTDRSQTFPHGRLCVVGYDTVGFIADANLSVFNRPYFMAMVGFISPSVGFLANKLITMVGYMTMWSVL